MIVGGPGSGKSTLARALGERTGLPVFHMDHIHYTAGWVERSTAEKSRLTHEVHARDVWIFEGGHSATHAERIARADTVVWLDVPIARRLVRVVRRTLRYRGMTRPDLPPGCPERLNLRTLEFLWVVWRTRRTSRAKLARIGEEARSELRFVRLIDDAEVADFLASVPRGPGEAGQASEGARRDGRAGRRGRRVERSAPDARAARTDAGRARRDLPARSGRLGGGPAPRTSISTSAVGASSTERGTWHVLMSGGRIGAALIVHAEGFSLPAGCHGIGSVATAPDARRRGHASRLLEDVLKALERSGSRGVFLFADVETSLYARHGFEPVDRADGASCLWRAFGSGDDPPGSPSYF